MGYGYYGFAPYVSQAERRKRAARKLAQLRKKGHDPQPVEIAGRNIATTFWGKAWCTHLESYADYESRLPRGRTYVRNGSVIDLQVTKGELRALVSGSEIYEVLVRVAPLAPARWKRARKECAGQIGTVVELLSGGFSTEVMAVLCHREKGIFPGTREIEMGCSCPDGVFLCKHLAAVLYGVGARLDRAPELLFTLRGVDGGELIAEAGRANGLAGASSMDAAIGHGDLGKIFGIEMEGAASRPARRVGPARKAKKVRRKAGKKTRRAPRHPS